jgi:hypothetical protein
MFARADNNNKALLAQATSLCWRSAAANCSLPQTQATTAYWLLKGTRLAQKY